MAEDDFILSKRLSADAKELIFRFPTGSRSQYIREYVQNIRFWEFGSNRRVLQMSRLRMPEGAFVDVGAGLGIECVLASEIYPLVYAFEVNPENIPYLIKNIEANRIQASIIQKSVSEQSNNKVWIDQCQVKLGVPFDRFIEEAEDGQLAETVALGDYPFEHEISFLHVDTEGMEAKVLLGAARAIQRQGKTPYIRFTFHPSRMKEFESSAADLIKFFEIFQYSLFIPSPVQLAPISFTALQMLYHDWKDLTTHPWLTLYAFPDDARIYASAI